MINPEELNKDVKMFKNGNSFAFRVSKKDRDFLGADESTEFEKVVSPDGKAITFRKVENVRPEIMDIADKLMDKHADLMQRLERL
ncbi:AbrB family transcriptional regulator [Companilactobacillus allii]|uniref:AbrB family transcriptional regulator n=1 Tax=Companilactobacillus allii TaxID=1847728 RepID=A0A1P8Q2X1_9LACO|nr:AbrB family transcriptional regulator [Companilactobacillus allii]APX72149.1 AbrB family transcriptional regulator [Companilactobacillus allii]USQ69246.1 AbrB family transcriptional regulator [Companilactobacillus allii]